MTPRTELAVLCTNDPGKISECMRFYAANARKGTSPSPLRYAVYQDLNRKLTAP